MSYILKLQWKTAKKSVVFLLLTIPITVGITVLTAYLTKSVVYNVINNAGIQKSIISLIIICLAITLLKILQQAIGTYNSALMADFRREVTYVKNKKILYTDYENIENPECRYLLHQANQALWATGAGAAIERAPGILVQIIINIINFFLFGSLISIINPYLIIVLIAVSAINYLLVAGIHKYQYKNRIETAELDRKLWYIAYNSGDISGAKDIRLFNMQSWFSRLFQRFTKERLAWSRKIAARHYIANVIETVFISHRLSSCRFCDKILVIDNGKIVQEGSHSELIKDEKGLYYELWNAQAQYYACQGDGSSGCPSQKNRPLDNLDITHSLRTHM